MLPATALIPAFQISPMRLYPAAFLYKVSQMVPQQKKNIPTYGCRLSLNSLEVFNTLISTIETLDPLLTLAATIAGNALLKFCTFVFNPACLLLIIFATITTAFGTLASTSSINNPSLRGASASGSLDGFPRLRSLVPACSRTTLGLEARPWPATPRI